MSKPIALVENPRRKRRRRSRRSYSAKQKAAGFGGKRRMRTRRKKRRNPSLATLAANPRRRRRRRSYSPVRRRRYSRRRNPGLGNVFGMIDIKSAAFVTTGVIASRVGPGLVAKVWPSVPTSGIAGHAVRLGVIITAGYVTKFVTKSSQRAALVVTGGIAAVLYDLFNQYAAPKLGLYGSGMSGYVTDREIAPFMGGVSGYVPRATSIGTEKVPVPMEQMAM